MRKSTGSILAVASLALIANLASAEKPRVLMLAAKGVNMAEYNQPRNALTAAGYVVEVAGPHRGKLDEPPEKRPDAQVAEADLTLDEVDVANYIGLVLPGGYAPGNLEKIPRALDICREFAAAGKPISAICHGPRLLMRAGLMKGKAATCLAGVADELADAWRAGESGFYLDRPVVMDGTLVTSRWPNDLNAFIWATLALYADNNGLPLPTEVTGLSPKPAEPEATAMIELAPGFNETAYMGLRTLLEVRGEKVAVTGNTPGWLRGKRGMAEEVTILKGDLPKGALPRVITLADDLDTERLPEALRATASAATAPPDKAPWTAAIALREGFDERVYAAMETLFRSWGRSVLVLGPGTDELTGMCGMRVKPMAAYGSEIDLSKDAIIVAPGFLWPQKNPDARQANQPEWIEEQDKEDMRRAEWLMERYRGGATLVAFGLESFKLATFEDLKGKEFACIDSDGWRINVIGGKYDRAKKNVVLTAERLITGKNADALADVVKAMQDSIEGVKD